jgi:formimidoylglutamase
MKYTVPSNIKIKQPNSRIGSFSNLFHDWHEDKIIPTNAKIGILGVPYDVGVTLGGGRPGASLGPDAVREAFKKLGTTYFYDYDIDLNEQVILDFGNVEIDLNSQESTYKQITSSVETIINLGIIPIVIGGGHDISHATIKALSNSITENFGGLNIDAHLDVRENPNDKIISGSPFRMAIESNNNFKAEHFYTIGVNHNYNAKIFYDYLRQKNSKIVSVNQLRQSTIEKTIAEALSINNMFLSVDIDVISQAFAPGCSAPNVDGLEPNEVFKIALLAGKSKKIKLFDLMEVNPIFDHDFKTARIAAMTIANFILGMNL